MTRLWYLVSFQSKERLIASLKEGSGAAGENDTSVMSIELEEMKNERDHLKDEVQHSKMAIDNLRAELQVIHKEWYNIWHT